VARERQPALLRTRRDQRGHAIEQLAQIEILRVQFQPAGLDAGQVQGVVDQPQQVAAGVLDRTGVAALALVQRRGQQQFAHAQHAGHRRAHLVAKRGQEVGLGLRGLFGQLALVLGQLPGAAAAQPQAVQVQRSTGQQQCQQRPRRQSPGAAPPRRQHAKVQGLDRRPHPVAAAALDLQCVASGRQAREQPLAAHAHLHPVRVVAAQSEAITAVVSAGK
jgi:hypothetical protein